MFQSEVWVAVAVGMGIDPNQLREVIRNQKRIACDRTPQHADHFARCERMMLDHLRQAVNAFDQLKMLPNLKDLTPVDTRLFSL